VARQLTQVPKTSKKRARGAGDKAIVTPGINFAVVIGSGAGDVRSFCTGRIGKLAMEGARISKQRGIGKAAEHGEAQVDGQIRGDHVRSEHGRSFLTNTCSLMEKVEFYCLCRQALRMREGDAADKESPLHLSGAVQQKSRQQHKGRSDMTDYAARHVQTEEQSRLEAQTTKHDGRQSLW
jgi:hypothetical protein